MIVNIDIIVLCWWFVSCKG